MYRKPELKVNKNIKILLFSLLFIILNNSLTFSFMKEITVQQQVLAQKFEQELQKTYSQIFTFLDLVNYNLSFEKWDGKNSFNEETEKNLIMMSNLFIKERLLIVDKNAEVLYNGYKPLIDNKNITSTIIKLDYFPKCVKDSKDVHDGLLVGSFIDSKPILPFCRSIVKNGQIKGVALMAICFDPFISSINSSEIFKINHPLDKPNFTSSNKLYSIFQYIFPAKNITIGSNTYYVTLQSNSRFLKSYLRYILPWNVVFLLFIYIFTYKEDLRNKTALKLNDIVNLMNNNNIPTKITSENLPLNVLFTELYSALVLTVERIKQQDSNIINIQKTFHTIIDETKKLNNEIDAAGYEIDNIINDKEIKLNDEQTSALLEYKDNTYESTRYLESILELIHRFTYEMKIGKQEIEINDIIDYFKPNFKSDTYYLYNQKILIYKDSFFSMLDLVKSYFSQAIEDNFLSITITNGRDDKINIVVSSVKTPTQSNSFTDLDNGIIMQKIKFLSLLNGFFAVIKDSENGETLTIKQK